MDSTAGTGASGHQDGDDLRVYATKGVGPNGLPREVVTIGECPYDGKPVPIGTTRKGLPRKFCSPRCKSNWHAWRSNLAGKRIAEAAKAIEAELPFLRRG